MLQELKDDWSITWSHDIPREDLERQYKECHSFKSQLAISEEDRAIGKRGNYQKVVKKLFREDRVKYVKLLGSLPSYQKSIDKEISKRYREKYFSTIKVLRVMDASTTNTLNYSGSIFGLVCLIYQLCIVCYATLEM